MGRLPTHGHRLLVTGERSLSFADLEDLRADHPELAHLKALHLGGRSLLNRTADGNLRFAHRSIQEFLVVHSLVEGKAPPRRQVPASDQILRFLFSWLAEAPAERLSGFRWHLLDLTPVEAPIPELESLAGADLSGADLRDAYLRGVDLAGADLGHASLIGADLRDTDLRGANLVGADRAGADFRGAQLAGALFMDHDALPRHLVRQGRPVSRTVAADGSWHRSYGLRELDRLSDQDRRKLYLEVPEKVPDPLQALAILDQLRHQVQSRGDLAHLDFALMTTAERWPDQQEVAEGLARRLYADLSPPPEELFRSIETHDGVKDLWPVIPAGSFQMGSPDYEEGRWDREGPLHEVVITSPFRLAAVPVTNAQFAAFEPGFEPHRWKGVSDEELALHPAVNVTWYQAMSFCRWLAVSFPWAEGARLPTEEEWEYACRGRTQSRYWSGKDEADLRRVGWYDANSDGRTHRVGRKEPNRWGLYDVHGNVEEWTLSEWTDDYSGREDGREVDPVALDPADLAAASGARRVTRGGRYGFGAQYARSACRGRWDPGSAILGQGFRVLLPGAPRFPAPRS